MRAYYAAPHRGRRSDGPGPLASRYDESYTFMSRSFVLNRLYFFSNGVSRPHP